MKIAPYTERWNEGECDWSYVEDPRAEIERWEYETGLQLPAEYRTFMLRFNGGRVYPRQFRTPLAQEPIDEPMYPNSDVTYVDIIMSWASVESHWRGDTYGEGVPPQYLIIADTPGPIQLLMAMTDADYGKIFSWYHSQYTWGTDGNDKMYFQSDCFRQFIQSLVDEDGTDFQSWRLPIYDKLARDFEV